MSMPEFPNPSTILTHEQAIDAILTSIAMEELALSHIINAEGEKIQKIIQRVDNSNNYIEGIKVLLDANESAALLIEKVTDLQLILKNKMRLAEKFLPQRPETPLNPLNPSFRPERPERPCSR